MFAAVQLNTGSADDLSQWFDKGRQASLEARTSFEKYLNETYDTYKEGFVIDGNKLMTKYFPPGEYGVFLSHSHSDENLVLGVAGYLEHRGLRVFVDSIAWDYVGNLLHELDQHYCLKESGLYDYKRRNVTTSYAYMLLETSLTKMMDACETLFFLSTPQSVRVDRTQKNQAYTYSPFLFHELQAASLLRRTVPKRPLLKYMVEKRQAEEIKKSVPSMRLDATDYLDSLYTLGIHDLETLSGKGTELLDNMYRKLDIV